MTMKRFAIAATAAALGLGASASYADSSFMSNFIQTPTQYLDNHPLIVPAGASLFAPTGFGADFGVVSATLVGVNEWPGGNQVDGAAALGAGLGNGDKYIGASVNASIDSLGVRDTFGETGSVGLKLFRWVTPTTSIAVGSNNLVGWGQFANNAKTYYGAVTQQFSLFKIRGYDAPFTATAGVGTGALVSSDQFNVEQSDSKAQGFGALAFSPVPRINLIVDYTSLVWSTGVSGMPFATIPFIATVYATNLGGANKVAGPVTYGAQATIAYKFM